MEIKIDADDLNKWARFYKEDAPQRTTAALARALNFVGEGIVKEVVAYIADQSGLDPDDIQSMVTVNEATAADLNWEMDASQVAPPSLDWSRPWDTRDNQTNSPFDTSTMVNIITMEDTLVCQKCQDVADDSPYTLEEAQALLPVHPNCLLGDSFVTPAGRITAVSERFYNGDLVIFRTASGRELASTPNHPILTDKGWIAARLLEIGCDVISRSIVERMALTEPQDQQMPTRIEDIVRAFLKLSQTRCFEVPLARPDFHGDVANGEVAVIGTNRLLRREKKSAFGYHARETTFNRGIMEFKQFADFGALDFDSNTIVLSTPSFMSRRGLALAPDLGHATPFDAFLFRRGAQSDVVVAQNSIEGGSTAAISLRQRIYTITGQVLPDDCALDAVTYKGVRHYSGPVFNLETTTGYYFAEGIATHNCRCLLQNYVSYRRLPVVFSDSGAAPPQLLTARGLAKAVADEVRIALKVDQ